jgi:hypothetical protein
MPLTASKKGPLDENPDHSLSYANAFSLQLVGVGQEKFSCRINREVLNSRAR